MKWPKITRDTVIAAVGLGLIVNEAVFREGPERPYLIMLFAGMIGLPLFFRNDEKKQKQAQQERESSEASSSSLPPEPRKPTIEFRGLVLA